MLRAMTRVVGLTGGIGTGKSTVSRMLAARGAHVIDADAIVHELQAPGMPMLAELAAAFGPEVVRADGSLDRAALGLRVFADSAARRRLGEITHPDVGREMLRRLAAARDAGARLVVLDNPLLFEGRARRAATARGSARDPEEETILVYAPVEMQIARQIARDRVAREYATQRLAAQMGIEEKIALATWVIDNSGPIEATERQVVELLRKLLG
jgi:dephospho-CoA kinase